MADQDRAADVARLLLESIIGSYRALQDQVAAFNRVSAATSAVFRVLAEHFPDLAEKYEQYRKDSETSSPHALATQQAIEKYEKVIQQLQGLQKKL